MERLDQAFRQSYYHTQRLGSQPLGACVGAALDGKMRAITLDFKASHHGRTLPYKRTDPRVFHGAFPGRAVSGHGGKISAERPRIFLLSGWSACHEGHRYGLEEAPSERRKLFAVYRQRISGSPELPVQFSRLRGVSLSVQTNAAKNTRNVVMYSKL